MTPIRQLRPRQAPLRAIRCRDRDASADLVVVTDSRLLGGNLPAELRNQGASLSGLVYRTVLGERQTVAGIEVSLQGTTG